MWGRPYFMIHSRFHCPWRRPSSAIFTIHYPPQMMTNAATLWVLSLLMSMLTPLGCALLAYFATGA